jgi:hypothetical protein
MADFWWRHVVPARLALESPTADPAAVRSRHCPPGQHPYSAALRQLSTQMLRRAPQRLFTGEQTRSQEAWADVIRRRTARVEAAEAGAPTPAAAAAGPDGPDQTGVGGALSTVDSGGYEPQLPAGALALAEALAAGAGGQEGELEDTASS